MFEKNLESVLALDQVVAAKSAITTSRGQGLTVPGHGKAGGGFFECAP
jgi:hypothetical protein